MKLSKYLLSLVFLVISTITIAQNTLPASGNVGINTTTPAYNLDVHGRANIDTLLVNKYQVLNMPVFNPERGGFNPIWMGIRTGKRLHPDEQFANGLNGINMYNNSGNGVVTVSRLAGTGIPNASGYYVEVKHTGTAVPGLGGFYQVYTTAANRTFVHVFRAKLPAGYILNHGSNALGTNGFRYWITNNAGTGKWEDYAYVVQCGNPGSFSTAGYVYVTGSPTPTDAEPLIWQIASSATYDVTSLNGGAGSNINADFLDSLNSTDFLRNQEASDQVASFRINGNGFLGGNVGIGTSDTKGYKLAVNGNAIFTRVKVKAYGSWPDYVFCKEFQRPSLPELEQYITENKHLPEIPSAKEIEQEGQDVGEMNKKLLQKVEELTLYLIEEHKQNKALNDRLKQLEEKMEKLITPLKQ